MLVPNAVDITENDEHGRFDRVRLFRPIVRFQVDTDDLFDELWELGRIVPVTTVLFLDGSALEHLCVHRRVEGLYLWPPSVMRIRPGQNDEPTNTLRVADGQLEGDATAHAVPEHVGALDLQVTE